MSSLFVPTLKENPQEAEIASHSLMLRAGMIRQLSSGVYIFTFRAARLIKLQNS